jgi:hypothetical protein
MKIYIYIYIFIYVFITNLCHQTSRNILFFKLDYMTKKNKTINKVIYEQYIKKYLYE